MRALWIVPLSSGCLAFWTPCDPDDEDLLADGGFESLQCWEDPEGTWTEAVSLDVASGTPRVEPAARIDTTEQTGTIQLKQQGGNALMRATLYVDEGQGLRIGVWSKADAADRVFEVQLVEAESGAPLHSFEVMADTTWGQASVEVEDLPGGDVALVLDVGGSEPGTLWLDDVSLQRL